MFFNPPPQAEPAPAGPKTISYRQDHYIQQILRETGQSWDKAADWLQANRGVDLTDTPLSKLTAATAFDIITGLKEFKAELASRS